ncbi:maleylpyruvate isomerase family mycothiol-dependent enzyme [Streptomyces sp. NPDC003247]|uniref:maleylpyruvate isomerase family mycothiol-dependent enzyme n=1 Tax=Streptomyces sp. NPDC003247 TaxID=3364677 RepID=UPI0036739F29
MRGRAELLTRPARPVAARGRPGRQPTPSVAGPVGDGAGGQGRGAARGPAGHPIVAAGPAEAPPAKDAAEVPRELEALLAWYAESNELLLSALREAGPERECWAWWGAGVSPANAWGVARRRVHEVLVHTYDAQLAAGAVQPMPADVAIDGVAEFLDTCNSTPAAWPHEAATIHYHATEGRSWLLALDGTGAWPAPLTDDAAPASASARGTAEQLLLFVWGRLTLSDLKIEGDQQVFEQLIAWEPEE